MSIQPNPQATGGEAQSSSPGASPHAYVDNGHLFIMDGGRYVECSRTDAFWLWFGIHDSPSPSTQERARQIRAAMDEAYPERLVA